MKWKSAEAQLPEARDCVISGGCLSEQKEPWRIDVSTVRRKHLTPAEEVVSCCTQG